MSPASTLTEQEEARLLEIVQQTFDAARSGDLSFLSSYLEGGGRTDLMNGRGDTLLILAAYYDHSDIVALLLNHEADPDARNDAGQTALAGACYKGHAASVDALLAGGAGVNAPCGNGQTALTFCVLFGHPELAGKLIAHGADPRRADADGNSPLSIAQSQNNAAMVAALSENL